jgi:hypothetical protein
MTSLEELQGATSLNAIAELLAFKPKALAYLLYIKSDEEKYRQFEIPKKLGGTRIIKAPSADLALLQKRLSNLLLECLAELRDSGRYRDDMSLGFQTGRGIVDNASVHRGRRYVFNIDFQDFFETINFGRVRGFFLKDRNFSLHPPTATILAQIACHQNSLPQGSPCSPVISNLVGHLVDVRCLRLAASNGCSYTRYADDLTFSTNKPSFPTAIASRDVASHEWSVGAQLVALIGKAGFKINVSKTRMQYADSRQEVTGLIVNKKVNVRSEYRKTVRAMAHHLFTRDEYTVNARETDILTGAVRWQERPGTLNQLHGMLGFVDTVDRYNAERLGTKKAPITQKETIYKRFLMYKFFHLAKMPFVVCEGKTDSIYLRCAIEQLAAAHPELSMRTVSGQRKLGICFYRYADTSTDRVLGLKGGSGELPKFMDSYLQQAKKFRASTPSQPLIILVDNDSGADAVYAAVKKRGNRKDPFIHVGENLYVMATPYLADGKPSTIEDFFDDATREMPCKDRVFSPDENADQSKFFGKYVFATEIVQKNADRIDFSRFGPILQRIEQVIAHFDGLKKTGY